MSIREEVKIVIDAVGDGAKRVIKDVGDTMHSGLGQKAKMAGAAVGAGMVAAGAAIAKFTIDAVNDTTAYAEGIDKMAKTTGAGTDELQKLAFAAGQEHTSVETLEKGLNKLAKTMEGTPQKFADIGVATQNADGSLRNTTDVLMDVADWMQNCGDDAQKQAVAMELFGKSGAEMVPFLEQGSSAIRATGDEAERLGMVMSGDSIAAFESYGDTVDKMKSAFQGLQMQAAQAVLPAFDGISGALTDMMVKFRESGTLDKIFGPLGDVLVSLQPAIEAIVTAFAELMTALGPSAGRIFEAIGVALGKIVQAMVDSGLMEVIEQIAVLLADAVVQVLEEIEPSLPDIAEVLTLLCTILVDLLPLLMQLLDWALAIAGGVLDVVTAVIGQIAEWIRWLWEKVAAFFGWIAGHWSDIWNGIKDTAVAIWNAIAGFFTAIWNGIKAAAEAVWNAVAGFFTAVWNGIKVVCETIWDAIRVYYETLWAIIKTLFETVWNTITTILQTAWDIITGIATIAWETIKSVIITPIQTVWDWLVQAWGFIQGALETAWNTLVNVASSAWETIKSVIWSPIEWLVNTLGGVWDGLVAGWQAVWQGLKDFFGSIWSGITDTIKGGIRAAFDIAASALEAYGNAPSYVPLPWKNEAKELAAKLRAFKEGGIITGPTVGLFGEAGREAVIPLETRQGRDVLAGAVAAAGGSGGGDSFNFYGGVTVIAQDYQDVENKLRKKARDAQRRRAVV